MIKNTLKALARKLKPQTNEKIFREKWNNLQTAIAFVIANNIEGDYLEFGVYKGESFIYAYDLYNEIFKNYKQNEKGHEEDSFMKQNVKFYAFDSFEGLPANHDEDVPLHWTGEKPMSYPRHLFEQNLKRAKVNFNNVEIIEGFYDKTLNTDLYKKLDLKKAAIIHIDCDLYESTKTVLDTIKPLLVEGSVLIFDDYHYYKGSPYKGERGAFNEWLNQNPQYVTTELSKTYPAAAFIINERDENAGYERMV